MSDGRNRPDSKKATNDWLTPPELVEAAGPFDLDPCAFQRQPWRTAATMVTLKADRRAKGDMVVADGLAYPWDGQVFCNPPWDDPLPWAEKMARHGRGMFLSSAKSSDTRWAQAILASATAVLFFKGRLLYHFPNGAKSKHGWTPSMLAAFGNVAAKRLDAVAAQFPGVVLLRDYAREARNS